jgi:biotin operon repressor
MKPHPIILLTEAGRAIGCSDTTILNALNRLQKEGVHKLIKNRYLVKL